ncbi:hypothetical protein [Plantactinospora sp. B5E13]|uniref:hypothetical protein n=1 Tax=unclassified Plantactinospora TaxID=2631981 RepID=UPI00325F40EF
MTQELRDGLARLADPVVSRPEPYRRLLERARRRRRRQALTTGAAALAALVAVVPLFGGTVRGGEADPADQVEIQPPAPVADPLARRLLDSPLRGNLAGDHQLIESITRGYRAARAELRVDPTLDAVRVLFAHDLPTARVVVVVFADDEHAVLRTAIGDPGASVRGLLDKTGTPIDTLPFESFVNIARGGQHASDDVTLALGPAGCQVESTSNGQLTADGTVRREWRPTGGDGYVVAGPEQVGERWRFRCDGVVRYDTVPGVTRSHPRPDATAVPPGTPDGVDPTAAANAARALTEELTYAGLAVGPVQVRWHGRIPGASADTPPALLVTSCAAGGGCAALLQVGTGRTESVRIPSGGGSLVLPALWRKAVGRPDLVVAQIPADPTDAPADPSGRPATPTGVLVVGPAAATRVELLGAGKRVVAEGPLDGGVGRLEPGAEEVSTVRVYDAANRPVASMPVRPGFGSVDFGEEWPSR